MKSRYCNKCGEYFDEDSDHWYRSVIYQCKSHYLEKSRRKSSERIKKSEEEKEEARRLSKEKKKARVREYVRTRRKRDPEFHLAHNIRTRLNMALRSSNKDRALRGQTRHWGITMKQFMLYIENQFRPGMTWENRGEVWELDHVEPLSEADLSDEGDYLYYTGWLNYQPLFKKDNRTKSGTSGNSF
jgi:hypothetical protein